MAEKSKSSLTTAEMEAMAGAAGFKAAPPDHPIYSEGPTITFLRRAREAKAAPGRGAAKMAA
jgi:hypothetical protein